jgi:hypothetical protein
MSYTGQTTKDSIMYYGSTVESLATEQECNAKTGCTTVTYGVGDTTPIARAMRAPLGT